MATTPSLSRARLSAYRAEAFCLRPDLRVATREQAIAFVNRRGFVHFWPVKDVVLPSLWVAVAGDRPVPSEHDDPGHITWGWKDELLGARRWYYAKVLRRKATFIALDVVPYFYALSENYGEPERDYLVQYREGRLPFEAKAVYETLLTEGPLDTVSLRRLAHLGSRESDARFARALELLQADFKILPVGVAEAGAWRYAFVYDLVHRFYPDLPELARPIRQADARRRLAELYLRSVGASPERAVAALFGWRWADTVEALDALDAGGVAVRGVGVEGETGDWVALRELL
ncbi:MAG: winged helix DNA-binding domain-containing protein [Caldilineales bacterium]|nr:winged helix DNA-binding domain-containing protein [Caldilineales bacterium]MDW8317800.1 crosslink repair DNA glycosylase YcaQ family protein [Anaerolineae bacterium]